MRALRSVRQHFSVTGRQEQRCNFAPYSTCNNSETYKGKGKRRATSCSFKMVSLSSPQDLRVPTVASHKEMLLEAGLGAKTIDIPDINCTKEEFREVITSSYPKLYNCGGFELLLCMTNSRELESISPTVSQSPKLLKAIVGNGKIFVRPLQKELDLDSVEEELPPSFVSKKHGLLRTSILDDLYSIQ